MNDIEFLGEKDEVVPHGFVVDTQEKAEWALRKKGAAEAEIDKLTVYAMALKDRIDARLEEITKTHRNTLEAMDAMIRPWADVEIAKANGRKSVKLIGGTVGYRQSPASLVVTDEDGAVAWLRDHAKANGSWNGTIRVKEEVIKTTTKKCIEESGEVPDGCELRQGDIRFYAEPLPPLLE